MCDDFFGTFDDVFIALPAAAAVPSAPSAASDPEAKTAARTTDRIWKRSPPVDLAVLVSAIRCALNATAPSTQETMRELLLHVILHAYGQRQVRKDSVDEDSLTPDQREVYRRIRREMDNPQRRERVLEFIQKKEITRRLINYFVVHYSLVEREISYYLDKTSYPYKILGELNQPNQPDILRRIEQGDHIVFLNFHTEYKNSKNKYGRRNRHAPYRRSTAVRGGDDSFE